MPEDEPPFISEVNLLALPCAACQHGDHEDCDDFYCIPDWAPCPCQSCHA